MIGMVTREQGNLSDSNQHIKAGCWQVTEPSLLVNNTIPYGASSP